MNEKDPIDDISWSRVYPTGFDQAFIDSLAEMGGLDEKAAIRAYESLGAYVETPHCEMGIPNASLRIKIEDNHGLPEVESRRVGNIAIELRELLKFRSIDPLLLGVEVMQEGITPELFVFRAVWTLWAGTKRKLPQNASILFAVLARDAKLPCNTREAYENSVASYEKMSGADLDYDWFQNRLDEFTQMRLLQIDADILTIADRIVWKFK